MAKGTVCYYKGRTKEQEKNIEEKMQHTHSRHLKDRPLPQSTASPTAPPFTVLLGLLGARL